MSIANWLDYDTFLIVSLSGQPVYDPNLLRSNPNPKKPVSSSCRVRGLGQTLTPLPARSSRESLFFLHTLKHFFTLSHSLPLQESHLYTRLLIAEIQANLARNKANKMVDKIQPYKIDKLLFVPKVKVAKKLWI